MWGFLAVKKESRLPFFKASGARQLRQNAFARRKAQGLSVIREIPRIPPQFPAQNTRRADSPQAIPPGFLRNSPRKTPFADKPLHHLQFALEFLQAAPMFASGGFIGAFAPDAGLFVELPFTQLGQNAGFLAFLLEAFQGALDGLAFLDLDQNQKITPFSGSKSALALAAAAAPAGNPPTCGLFFYRILCLLSKEKTPGFPLFFDPGDAPPRVRSPP
jgi:hypothetical protein